MAGSSISSPDKVYDCLAVKQLIVGDVPGTAGGGSATNPSLAFGDGDTGFYESADDVFILGIGGANSIRFDVNLIQSLTANSWKLANEQTSATNPTLIPNKDDDDTGISRAGADALSLIAGGVEAVRLTEASSHVLQKVSANVGLTADVGSIQGGLPLLSSYNVISTSGTAGDSCTLPATFGVGTIVLIKNDAAANAVDVFPASGDDLGAGADTAASLTNGRSAMYMGTVANSTWTKMLDI